VWLWAGAALWLPLPYLVLVDGSVPLVRFAMLGAVSAAYAAGVDGSGVAWVMTGLLWSHVAVHGLLVAGAAGALAWLIPGRIRAPSVAALLAAGLAVALFLDVYHTPFGDVARTSWLGLLR